MKLTRANYHSNEANRLYWSVSQFKTFRECEAKGLAEVQGVYKRPTTESLLMGSYVDASFGGYEDELAREHPEIFNKRTGELKAQYQKADRAIERVQRDPYFMKYLDGEKQKIMTGTLFGQEWKIMIDFYQDDKIVDLKFMRDMKNVYKDGEYKSFVDAWGYDIQGFVYQQIVKANTGKELPFYLAVITKEDVTDYDIIHIPQWRLNSTGEMVRYYTNKYAQIKNGDVAPERCGKCDYCRLTKMLTAPREYEELMEEREV